MSICRGCRLNLISSPGHNWLEFKCGHCDSKLCFTCGGEPHFPALCTEYLKWRTVGRPSERILRRVSRGLQHVPRRLLKFKYGRKVQNCQKFLQISEELYSEVESFGNLLHLNPTLLEINPTLLEKYLDLKFGIIELKRMIKLRVWIKMICSVNPLVEKYIRRFNLGFENSFFSLVEALPFPSEAQTVEAQVQAFSRFLRDAALAKSTLLNALLHARSIPGFQALALQPRNATLLPFDAIRNEINPVSPITLFQPLRGELDVTYLALLHQESSLLTSGQ